MNSICREDMGIMLGITIEITSLTIAEYKRWGQLVEVVPNAFRLDVPNLHWIAED